MVLFILESNSPRETLYLVLSIMSLVLGTTYFLRLLTSLFVYLKKLGSNWGIGLCPKNGAATCNLNFFSKKQDVWFLLRQNQTCQYYTNQFLCWHWQIAATLAHSYRFQIAKNCDFQNVTLLAPYNILTPKLINLNYWILMLTLIDEEWANIVVVTYIAAYNVYII